MKYIYYVIGLFLAFGFVGCAEDPVMDTQIQQAKSPEVNATELLRTMASEIHLKASILKQNGLPIDECGFCWSLSASTTGKENMRENRFIKADAIDSGSFTGIIRELKDSTEYHVYAYAINAIDTAFSSSAGVYTTINGVGEIYTCLIDSTTLRATSAAVKAVVKNIGEGIDSYGVYWSETNSVPSSADSVLSMTWSAEQAKDTSIFNLQGLKPLTRYYVRAFAKNEFGEFAFNVDTFTTTSGLPKVGTLSIGNAGFTAVEVSALLLEPGDETPTAMGFCWSADLTPEIDNGADTLIADSFSNGVFSDTITNLESAKKYYVRAYATNAFGMVYGPDLKIISTLSKEPNVITTSFDPSTLLHGSATVSGELQNGGESDAVKWGICWSEESVPTLSHTLITAKDSIFSFELTTLKGNTTYYYRAFATNKSGLTGYGKIYSFTTPSPFTYLSVNGADGRMFSTSFTIENKPFIVGGDLGETCSNELLNYAEVYSKWFPLSRCPVEAGQMAVCTLGSRAYLMGGLSKNGSLNSLSIYDVNVNAWQTSTPFPASPRYDAIGFSYRDSVYMLGGDEQNTRSKELWRFDPENQDWRRVTAAFPSGLKKGVAFVVNDRVFAGLGEGTEGRLWFASDSLTTWQSVSSVRKAVGQVTSAVLYQQNDKNSVFMINTQGKIWEYELNSDTWLEHSAFPQAISYHIFLLNNRLCILGQNLYNQSYFKIYDPSWDPAK